MPKQNNGGQKFKDDREVTTVGIRQGLAMSHDMTNPSVVAQTKREGSGMVAVKLNGTCFCYSWT
jgi:hypothetical protein